MTRNTRTITLITYSINPLPILAKSDILSLFAVWPIYGRPIIVYIQIL